LGIYDDARSDDKSVEPESVVTKMGDKTILFVGLERADAVMVYDVSNPAPKFYRLLKRVMRLRAYFIPVKSYKRSLVVVAVKAMVSLKYSNRI
jgi:hypothetical protein